MMTKLPPNPNLNIPYDAQALEQIVLAGGCFWGVEAYLRRIPGVCETQVGYANGHTAAPTYEQVCRGDTGHAEAVLVRYDAARLDLSTLLDHYFTIIDPTRADGQGYDIGDQYRTGIYYTQEAQLGPAQQAVARAQAKLERPVVTQVQPLTAFYPAEENHQDYLEKNPNGYCHISFHTLPTAGEHERSGP